MNHEMPSTSHETDELLDQLWRTALHEIHDIKPGTWSLTAYRLSHSQLQVQAWIFSICKLFLV